MTWFKSSVSLLMFSLAVSVIESRDWNLQLWLNCFLFQCFWFLLMYFWAVLLRFVYIYNGHICLLHWCARTCVCLFKSWVLSPLMFVFIECILLYINIATTVLLWFTTCVTYCLLPFCLHKIITFLNLKYVLYGQHIFRFCFFVVISQI